MAKHVHFKYRGGFLHRLPYNATAEATSSTRLLRQRRTVTHTRPPTTTHHQRCHRDGRLRAPGAAQAARVPRTGACVGAVHRAGAGILLGDGGRGEGGSRQHARVELQVKRVGAELGAPFFERIVGERRCAPRGEHALRCALTAGGMCSGASRRAGGDDRGCVRGMAAVQGRHGLFEYTAQTLLLLLLLLRRDGRSDSHLGAVGV